MTTMKRLLGRSLCLVLFAAVTGCAASYGQGSYGQDTYRQTDARASMRSPGGQISVSYFYESLSPYGEWFQEPSYGWCWTPYDVSADWRPYSDGHWEYSDYGWSWASNEPWGWASYHYGRWFFDDSYGWVWVPGTEWAPAWVAWRYGEDYVGWAPLPPAASWDASAGLAFGDANSIPSHEWCFVPRQRVLDVSLRVNVIVVARNVTLLERSRDATRFEVRQGRPANVGIDVAQIETSVGRPVPRVRIVDVDAPGNGGGRTVGRDGVGFYRPRVEVDPAAPGPPPAIVERQRAIPAALLQRQRDEQQRKLESDLNSERARLARDQQSELKGRETTPAGDEVRKRHMVEQQAFEEHATLQRKVLTQRMEKQIVNPGKGKNPGKADNSQGKGKGRGKDKGADKRADKGDN
jgi:hypothetical protein